MSQFGDELATSWSIFWRDAPSIMERTIIRELHKALILLGADNCLLGTVNSWKKSLPDEMVLSSIQHWNEVTAEKLQERIEDYHTREDER